MPSGTIISYGYSLGGDFPCLVYLFMPNRSLEDRLLCRQGTYPLNWEYLFNIARGTARGLQFLHNMGDQPFSLKYGYGPERRGPEAQHTSLKYQECQYPVGQEFRTQDR
jgi:hypothetical protein